ncbi:hypothetical protein CVT24_009347 [Panaeolus cyanescens]|uniref:Uncharacterized protein n=1 Tax=Panaeolus cyanescens TaxID=181874 RepID=A0A409Y809_9AGAR|nr:hypothetical protein CVT24_009347 [Panaeolus cyanescens]
MSAQTNVHFIITFDALYIFGLLSLTALVSTAWWSSRIQRVSLWFLFMFSWIITSAANLLLLGQQTGNPPRFSLCLFQAALIYAAPALSATSGVAFMLHVYLSVRLTLKSNTRIQPLVTYLTWPIQIGLSRRENVVPDTSGMYCHIIERIPNKITAGIAIISMLLIIILDVLVTLTLRRLWRETGRLQTLHTHEHISLDSIIRIIVFGFCPMISLAVSFLQYVPKHAQEGAKLNIILAILPACAFLIFGSQRDILRAWRVYRIDDEPMKLNSFVNVSSMTDDGMRCPSQDFGDEDSLFGSPPPSPSASSAEREKSPALALPTSGSGASRFSTSTATGLQNVGTIALPGSHHDIELPMTPLALSLSHNVVTRPPALPGTVYKNSGGPPPLHTSATSQNAPPTGSALGMHAAPSAPSMSRASSLGVTSSTAGTKSRSKSKRVRQSSRSSNESTPQPRVEFDLPDPSGPLPAHFLRNQDKLLGVAGLVAGVKPATITHVRGTSASNPIIVDDDEDAPKLGRRPVQTKELYLPTKIDPSLLEAPSNKEIVSVLIRQKDIFPVLQSILKLIAPQPNTEPERGPFFQRSDRNAPSSSSSHQPPLKKRKLNRVPAGAADWDVPYPFKQGEGPEEYRQTWERERSKQLITQLVKLIKTAAVKAATKKYVQKATAMRDRERSHDIFNEPPPPTPLHPHQRNISRQESSSVPTPSTNLNVSNLPPFSSQTLPSTTSPNTSSAAFDHLISSLVAAQPHEPAMNLPSELPTDPPNMDPLTQGPIDQSLFDSWMDILQAFPVPFDGNSSTDSSQSTMNTSYDMNFGTGMELHDLSLSGLFPIPTPLSTSGSATPFADMTPTMPSADELNAMVSAMGDLPLDSSLLSNVSGGPMHVDSSTTGDHLIDPQLMMLSMRSIGSEPNPGPIATTQNVTANDAMDIDCLSPLTSTGASSTGGTGPTTPASAAWDFSMPDFLSTVGTGNDPTADEGMWRFSFPPGLSYEWLGLGGLLGGDLGSLGLGRVAPSVEGLDSGALAQVDKGKGKGVASIASFEGNEDLNTQSSGSTSPAATQVSTPSTDAVFQSLLQRSSLFTSIVPSFTGEGSTQSGTSSTPFSLFHDVLPSTTTEAVTDRKLKREDILKRAKEKRQKLQEELNKVKMQLWETTIEQAGLVNLAKKLESWEPQSVRSKDASSSSNGEMHQLDGVNVMAASET